MSERVSIELRIERDQTFTFTVLNAARTAAINVTGWATSFMLKKNKSDADAAAVLTKTNGVISGTFNADPDINTQVITVTVADTDVPSATFYEGLYYFEFERTDAGFETPLADGDCEAILGVQR